MDEKKRDQKEFEEWLLEYKRKYSLTLYRSGWTVGDIKNTFLASRRLLREKEGKNDG